MLASTRNALLSAIPISALALSLLTTSSLASDGGKFLPTGVQITPTAATGSTLEHLNPGLADFPKDIASGAMSTVKSPDGKTLLVLIGGYNSLSDKNGNTIAKDSNEYVFVFDIATGKPVKKQVIQVPNTFVGIVFDPAGKNFYVGGPLPGRFAKGKQVPKPTHDAGYWAAKTKGFDFSQEDRLCDPEKFNRIIWEGLHGNKPYPTVRSGLDLRQNWKELLRRAGIAPSREGLASTESSASVQ